MTDRDAGYTETDYIALVELLRQIHSAPMFFDLYMVAGTAERAAEAIQRLRVELLKSDRALLVANKLWRLCVDEGWPWSDGSTQDDLTAIGLLYPKDMTTAEGEDGLCDSCYGDCTTCYRAVKSVEDYNHSENNDAK